MGNIATDSTHYMGQVLEKEGKTIFLYFNQCEVGEHGSYGHCDRNNNFESELADLDKDGYRFIKWMKYRPESLKFISGNIFEITTL
jgi:hypothetical protein